jgi:hypothetical protein
VFGTLIFCIKQRRGRTSGKPILHSGTHTLTRKAQQYAKQRRDREGTGTKAGIV